MKTGVPTRALGFRVWGLGFRREVARQEVHEPAGRAADRGLHDTRDHQVRAEELIQQAEEVRIQGRTKKGIGHELPARGDSQRPLVVVERVHLRREEQRVVVPQLEQVNQPEDERHTGDNEEPGPGRGLIRPVLVKLPVPWRKPSRLHSHRLLLPDCVAVSASMSILFSARLLRISCGRPRKTSRGPTFPGEVCGAHSHAGDHLVHDRFSSSEERQTSSRSCHVEPVVQERLRLVPK